MPSLLHGQNKNLAIVHMHLFIYYAAIVLCINFIKTNTICKNEEKARALIKTVETLKLFLYIIFYLILWPF